MKTIYILIFASFIAYIEAICQPIPVEVMAGDDNYWYQHVASKKIAQSKFSFFHVSSLHIYYEKERTDEIMSQSYISYPLVKYVSIAAGTFYATGPGFSPSLAVQLSKHTDNLFIMLIPRTDIRKNGSFEAMGLLEYRPSITKSLKLYSRFQAMSSFANDIHNRSYQNFRLGIDFRKIQFGAAMNIDEYGNERSTFHNAGIFVRSEL